MLLPCATLAPEADEKLSPKTFWQLSLLWSKTRSVPLLEDSPSFTTTVCPLIPRLHPAATSSSSHRTGCTGSKVTSGFEFKQFESTERWWSCWHVDMSFFLSGSFTNVYLTIKRALSNTSTLNRTQNDLQHWQVHHLNNCFSTRY